MQLLRCACPQCGTTLRVKDRAYVGRPIPCPACRTQLVLTMIDAEHLEAALADAPLPEQPVPYRPTGRSARLPSWLGNATIISWAATLVVAALIAGVAFWPKRRPQPVTTPANAASQVATAELPDQTEPALEEPGVAIPVEPRPDGGPQTDSPEDRLEQLSEQFSEYHDRHGRWPTEHPPHSLFFEMLDSQPMDDLARSIPETVNPLLPETTTAEGQGVTHFVGVAGVGEDAAELPVDHPRAGIFGTERITKREHVTDGLSQTLLLLGVELRFGPWSEAGPATMRPLTQEPYLHGPDGFGTGQADGMFALLADGSVQFLPEETHPVVMRRMAAMADGLPLDLSVPGDPAPMITQTERDRPAELPPAGVPQPEEPVIIAEPLPAIDFEAALSQPLESFRQDRAVPLREVLELLEEMIGAPIQYDLKSLGAAAEALDRNVTFDFEHVTVGDVLRKVLDKSELAFVREPSNLRVRLKADIAPDESSP